MAEKNKEPTLEYGPRPGFNSGKGKKAKPSLPKKKLLIGKKSGSFKGGKPLTKKEKEQQATQKAMKQRFPNLYGPPFPINLLMKAGKIFSDRASGKTKWWFNRPKTWKKGPEEENTNKKKKK